VAYSLQFSVLQGADLLGPRGGTWPNPHPPIARLRRPARHAAPLCAASCRTDRRMRPEVCGNDNRVPRSFDI